MMTSMTFWMLSEFAWDSESGTKSLELCLHVQTAIANEQLLALQVKYPDQYIYKSLDKNFESIICYLCKGVSPNEQWHIPLHQQMLEATIKWFHQVMGHPGEKCLHESLQQCYYHSKLQHTIDKFRCEHCRWHKLSGKGYELLPKQEMWTAPWEDVAIDLIGPWMVKVNNKKLNSTHLWS